MQNKRASISIGIMVIVTLVLFVFILVSLNFQASKLSDNFNAVSQLNGIYSEQQGMENTLHFRLVEVFLNSYQETLKENSLKVGKEQVNFKEIFEKKIYSKVTARATEKDSQLNDLFSGIDPVVFNGETVYVTKTPYIIEKNLTFDDLNGSRILYSSSLNSSVSFAMLELPSFNYINESYSSCSGLSSKILIEKCFVEKFSKFNMGVTIDSTKIIVSSRDKYYLTNKMQVVKFELEVVLPVENGS